MKCVFKIYVASLPGFKDGYRCSADGGGGELLSRGKVYNVAMKRRSSKTCMTRAVLDQIRRVHNELKRGKKPILAGQYTIHLQSTFFEKFSSEGSPRREPGVKKKFQ